MFGQRGKRRFFKTVGRGYRRNRKQVLHIHFEPQTQGDKVRLFCMNNGTAQVKLIGGENEGQDTHTAKSTLPRLTRHFKGPEKCIETNLERPQFSDDGQAKARPKDRPLLPKEAKLLCDFMLLEAQTHHDTYSIFN
jgi:hypothetical protein